jgi:hypothetical protein
MEVSSSLSELSRDISVESESLLNNRYNLLRDSSLKFGEMLLHECRVDRVEGVGFREVNGKEPEPSLESRVNDEGSSSGVHSSNVLSVQDLFSNHFLLVIPVRIVKRLTDEGNSGLGFIRI